MSFLPQWLLDVQDNCKQTSSLHNSVVEDISALRDQLRTFDELIASVRGKNDAEGSLRALTQETEHSNMLSHVLVFFAVAPLDVCVILSSLLYVPEVLQLGTCCRSLREFQHMELLWEPHAPLQLARQLPLREAAIVRSRALQFVLLTLQLTRQMLEGSGARSSRHESRDVGEHSSGHRTNYTRSWCTRRNVPMQREVEASLRRWQEEPLTRSNWDRAFRQLKTMGLKIMVDVSSDVSDTRSTRTMMQHGAVQTLMRMLSLGVSSERQEQGQQGWHELGCAVIANLLAQSEFSSPSPRQTLEATAAHRTLRKLLCSPSMAPRGHRPGPMCQSLPCKHAARALVNLFSPASPIICDSVSCVGGTMQEHGALLAVGVSESKDEEAMNETVVSRTSMGESKSGSVYVQYHGPELGRYCSWRLFCYRSSGSIAGADDGDPISLLFVPGLDGDCAADSVEDDNAYGTVEGMGADEKGEFQLFGHFGGRDRTERFWFHILKEYVRAPRNGPWAQQQAPATVAGRRQEPDAAFLGYWAAGMGPHVDDKENENGMCFGCWESLACGGALDPHVQLKVGGVFRLIPVGTCS